MEGSSAGRPSAIRTSRGSRALRQEPVGVLYEPTAAFIDADEHRLEALGIERREHVAGRENRDLVLGRLAAEYDSHTNFPGFWHVGGSFHAVAKEFGGPADMMPDAHLRGSLSGFAAAAAMALCTLPAASPAATRNLTGLPTYPHLDKAAMDDTWRTESLGRWCAKFTGVTSDPLDSVEDWYRRTLYRASETDLTRDERFKVIRRYPESSWSLASTTSPCTACPISRPSSSCISAAGTDSRASSESFGISPRPLRNDQDANDDDGADDRGRDGTAERETPIVQRLVQEIAQGRTQGAGQDECHPEQDHARGAGPEIQCRNHRQRRAEHHRTAQVAESGASSAIQSPSAVPSVWEK